MYNQHKILRVFQLINILRAGPAKSIRSLGNTLGVDNRIVYRYLDLLRELGFQLEKDTYSRYSMVQAGGDDPLHFTGQEAAWLCDLIATAGKESPIKDALLQKIQVKSDVQIAGQQLFKVHLSHLLDLARQGIEARQQIILQKYHSANSQNVEDRLVEPIHFTENQQHLVAFEPASQSIKHFHIERISGIEPTGQPFKYPELHRESGTDIFGFAANGQRHEIKLAMSLRAYLFLKEEYPRSIPFLKYDKASERYLLQVTVNSMLPIERFMKGLEGEVERIS